MATNRTATATVSYALNQASVAQVQQANQAVAASFATVQDATAGWSADVLALNPQLAQLAATQQQAANVTVQSNNQVANSFDAVAVAAQGAIDAEDSASKARQAAFLAGGDNSDGGIGVGGLRGGTRALGGLIGGEVGGGLRDVSRIVTLGSAFGVVGVAAGVAALAVKGYTDSLEASTERAKAFGDALEKAFESTTSGISDFQTTTKAQIAADTAARDALKKLADAAQPQLASNLDNASQSIANFLNNAAGAGDLYKPIQEAGISQEAYNAQVDDYNKKIQLAQIALDAYNAAIGTNIVLVNDAVAADKRISDAQLELAHASADAQTMTADARKKEADAISAHITALEESIDDYHITGAALVEVNAEINSLENRLAAVTDATHTWADTLADIEQRSTAVDNLFAATTAEDEAIQKVIAAQDDLTQSETDHADKLREIQTDEQDKETADRQKAAQSAEDDQAKHLQKLAEIDARYNADHEAAVGNRDALANYQAAQKRDDDTAKENANYVLQEQQLQAHLAEQLAQDRAAQQKQIESENQSYNRRHSQLVQALQNAQVEESRAAGLALAYQRQANDQQLNERIRANNATATVNQSANVAQESAAVVHQNALLNIAYAGGAALEQAFSGTFARLVQIASGYFAPTSYGINNTGGNAITGGYGNNTSAIQAIVNAQVANMIREANR